MTSVAEKAPGAVEQPDDLLLPLRGDSFSAEHLDLHFRQLAQSQSAQSPLALAEAGIAGRDFSSRFEANARHIAHAYSIVSKAARSGEVVPSEAEWLLDNYYVVKEQLREIRDDLPRGYYQELPKAISGYPRVYELARGLVTHTDSSMDADLIERCVEQYQTVTPLTIGEVWAVPIMLRLVLVENLNRLCHQMLLTHCCRQSARQLLDDWQAPQHFRFVIESRPHCVATLVQLFEQLPDRGQEFREVEEALERQVAESGWPLHDIVRQEHQRQAANQVSIGNVITSMRLIASLDWIEFFERVNHAERVLKTDPAGVYSRMHFESRDQYRHVVEELAKRTKKSDIDVAKMAIALARSAPPGPSPTHSPSPSPSSGPATTTAAQPRARFSSAESIDQRCRHVGYWLIDAGREELEHRVGYRIPLRQRLHRSMLNRPHVYYFGSLLSLTTLGLATIAYLTGQTEASSWAIVLLLALWCIPVSELALSITNLLVTNLLRPRLLPRLDFKTGVPADYPTIVVVPSLLTNSRDVHDLLERLESHYLSNSDRALSFALLTDFADAQTEHRAADESLLQQTITGIQQLNERYGADSHYPFYFFHRRRQWNEAEGKWMGWERKRGKLMEFGHWLHGATDTSYVVIEGDLGTMRRMRTTAYTPFIITLDSDTQLPHDAARKLIGTLAHPLNRPRFKANRSTNDDTRSAPANQHDDETVTSGYTILQPRVNVHLDGASKSWFSRIFAGSPGVDPYVTAASDVYQDLFGEGSFTGKGIYDLQAFERALANAFPENAILSHDLIEGCHARVGLVTNIEVYDGYPARYEADARRAHRWVRGDWQLLPWLLPRVPYAAGWKRNPLSWLSRWKVADNLRRSLVAPALLGALIGGWYARPELALWWAVAAWCVCLFPVAAQALMVVKNWPWKASFVEHLRTVVQDIGKTLAQCLLGVAVLPHKSLSMLDAITRTLWRMLVSRKHLLEWQTAAAVESQLGQPRWASLMQLWYLPLLAVAVALTIPAPAWLAAAPFLMLWLLAPALILLINQPIPSDRSTINDEQRNWLRAFISDTWSFFEAYGNSGDHWLPVDNVQEEPHERIAHRLSPTNEGLFLVSALVARDFGYIGIECLTTLWENNLSSLHRLEKFNGHFYNWYDTETLLPLNPRYVSTVDSGNLMACLLTVQAGIEELLDKSWSLERYRTGVLDSLSLLLQACRQVTADDSTELQKYASRILGAGESITQQFECLPLDWENWHASLGHVRQFTSFLVASELAVPTAKHSSQRYTHLVVKARVVHDRLAGMLAEYDQLYAWISWAIDVQRPTQGAQATGLSRLVNELLDRRSLRQVAELDRSLQSIADTLTDRSTPEPLAVDWRSQLPTGLFEAIHASSLHAQALVARLTAIAQQMESLAMGTDFRFLYNEQRRLFAIGLNVDEGRLDRSHYDMLCSESRLASYLAIAKGDVEAAHWFRLGRHATIAAGKFALLSWGGTMFEYLMPPLFQRQFDGSVLTQSCQAAVARQREYGRQQRVPWGISESAFGALAVNADYHYRSFGVPGLGLKRGLAKDLVISPYSTFMALTIDPAGSVANLQALIAEGAQGEWGFYEALDYTAERLPVNKRRLVVRCYMAHHQGMGLLALANLLDDHSIQRRFNAHPIVRAAELLLQERVPKAMIPFEPHVDEVQGTESPPSEQQLTSRRLTGVENSSPRTHLLSNGTYSVMLTSAGSGYSRSGALDVSRWRSDTTTDNWGQYIYIRDLTFNHIWSPTYQPTCVSPDQYEVIFAIDKVDFHRQQNDLETLLEVAISPENNTEVRQLKITNHGTETRQLEVTSYAEVSLAKSAADLAHPAFQKLFLETEFIAEEAAILARRRPRDAQQPAHWAVHVLAAPAEGVSRIEHETSRQAFLGRRRSVRNPQAIEQASLSGNTGAVLDPIFSIRCTLEIPAGASVTVAFSTAVAESRQEALALADQYHELRNVQRVFELAWAYAQVELRHQHLSPAQVHLYQKLAAYLLYPHWSLRGGAQLQRDSHLGQSGLWRHGISGDTPILLARVTEPEQLGFVRELVMAQRFWRERGFATDLILVNDYPGSYYDALQDQMLGLLQDIYRSPAHPNVYLIRGAQLPADELALMETVAACVLHGDQGTISQQIDAAQLRSQAYLTHTQHRHLTPLPAKTLPNKPLPNKPLPNKFSPSKLLSSRSPKVDSGNAPADQDLAARSAEVSQASSLAALASLTSGLEFWNGTGGFANDGREYRIHVQADHLPPMPWSQIVANERLGFLCTETGGGYTWFENSRENKLTTWSNDPVTDPPSEVLYVQDDVTGESWLPMSGITAEDGRAGVTCWAHYGAGYAKFHKQHVVWDQHVSLNVAPEDPVKFVRLTLTNRSAAARAVTVSYYVELVLGVTREQSHWHLQTEFDQSSRALLCRNPYHPEYAQQTVFLKCLEPLSGYTADRSEFLGRHGTWEQPAGLSSRELNQRTGVGFDPAGVVQTHVTLGPNETREITFLLGAGRDPAEAQALLAKYTDNASVNQAVQHSLSHWRSMLNKVQVRTPNRALDVLVNNWLIYQVLCCRMWARSAFYQSGGAYGFRDQLQDSMALVYSRPDVVRAHLLLAASRQYRQGDVQHWWHPPLGKGTRTRFSDDLLWLPLVACHYATVTQDFAVFDEVASFLESPLLQEAESERYEQPRVSSESATLYEHCIRAIEHGTQFGQNGLPLMGCGDWNDGMNKVGEGGQGESVWVGWFLLVLLDKFLPVMRAREDHQRANHYQQLATQLRGDLESNAWDGQWYRRAYFDDGTPLGSAQNDECQIDSLTQSWAVFAQANPERTRQAMAAATEHLVQFDNGLVLLFTPPFDQGKLDPGYIKGYLPGIRENGGQYTHAATWMIQALAELGDHHQAMELFDLINPINHTLTPHAVARYQTEPYVIAADVYGVEPHVGRGGWTWYTGSAAWFYRVAVEHLLGLKVSGSDVKLEPHVPDNWPEFQVTLTEQKGVRSLFYQPKR